MASSNDDRAKLVSNGNASGEKVSESSGDEGTFKTRIGIAFTCIGCMVGTGNIWRFPRILANSGGENGCLQFLIVWVLFLFMWSIPLLMIEYATGRYTKKSTIFSFQKLIGDNNMWAGACVTVITMGISAFYAVIIGWCIFYLFYFMTSELPTNLDESNAIFYDFVEDSWWPVLCHFVAILFGSLSVAWGVKSIELANSIIVPIFLIILLFTFIWSLTLEYAGQGLRYMFSPDWEKFKDPIMWVDGVTQNAFDTGAGSGLFISYAAFMTSQNGIVRYAILVPLCNNLISLFCGMLTFATVFATEIKNGSSTEEIVSLLQQNGPGNTGLTFIWMPILYNEINGGRVLMVFFFFALMLAGLSSLVAQLELFVHNIKDFGVSRKKATLAMAVLIFLLGLGSALSLEFLANQDFVWGFALLLSGMALLYLVIRYGAAKFRRELVNNLSTNDWHLPRIWDFIVVIIAPLEAIALLIWWAVDTIQNHSPWYSFQTESFLMAIVQWLGFLGLVILLNVLYVKVFKRYLPVTHDLTLSLPTADKLDAGTEGTYRTFDEETEQ